MCSCTFALVTELAGTKKEMEIFFSKRWGPKCIALCAVVNSA